MMFDNENDLRNFLDKIIQEENSFIFERIVNLDDKATIIRIIDNLANFSITSNELLAVTPFNVEKINEYLNNLDAIRTLDENVTVNNIPDNIRDIFNQSYPGLVDLYEKILLSIKDKNQYYFYKTTIGYISNAPFYFNEEALYDDFILNVYNRNLPYSLNVHNLLVTPIGDVYGDKLKDLIFFSDLRERIKLLNGLNKNFLLPSIFIETDKHYSLKFNYLSFINNILSYTYPKFKLKNYLNKIINAYRVEFENNNLEEDGGLFYFKEDKVIELVEGSIPDFYDNSTDQDFQRIFLNEPLDTLAILNANYFLTQSLITTSTTIKDRYNSILLLITEFEEVIDYLKKMNIDIRKYLRVQRV